MNAGGYESLFGRYRSLKMAVVGDFCLDRYLEIDPARQEVSIETGRPVHNVIRVRSQAGGAGTILNNLAALGVGRVFPVGFAGDDGEGTELVRALARQPGVDLRHFITTPHRRTFTYCKPLLMHPGRAPEELDRLDSKNWTPTPDEVTDRLAEALADVMGQVDGMILLDQVDVAETGVLTARLLERIGARTAMDPHWPVVADSRRGLRGFPPVIFKMNRAELSRLSGATRTPTIEDVQAAARALADVHDRPVVVTLAEEGMIGHWPGGPTIRQPAFPVRGPLDIVGAGDAVTANLAAALAVGATPAQALAVASAAASIVIHQLGTTGVATASEILKLLQACPAASS